MYGRATFTWLRNRKKQGYLSRQSKGILNIYDRGYTNLTGILSDYWRMNSSCTVTELCSL